MGKGGLAVWAFGEFDALREEARVTVARFCEIAGIPRASWYRRRSASSGSKGPQPTPAQGAVEADAETLAAGGEGWGHRNLAALKRGGINSTEPAPVSDSTMYRVLARNGLGLSANHTGEVRHQAGVRKQAFIDPPTRRNRLWQADFSEFDTNGAGTWAVSWTIWAKASLACTVIVAKTTADAIGFLATPWQRSKTSSASAGPKTSPIPTPARSASSASSPTTGPASNQPEKTRNPSQILHTGQSLVSARGAHAVVGCWLALFRAWLVVFVSWGSGWPALSCRVRLGLCCALPGASQLAGSLRPAGAVEPGGPDRSWPGLRCCCRRFQRSPGTAARRRPQAGTLVGHRAAGRGLGL